MHGLSPADEQSQTALASALRAAERAWERVDSAARGNRRAAYRSAARAVGIAERDVAAELRALKAGGYEDLVTSTYRAATVPKLKRVERKVDKGGGAKPPPGLVSPPGGDGGDGKEECC